MPRAVRHSGAMGKLEQERYATLVAMDILCVASRAPRCERVSLIAELEEQKNLEFEFGNGMQT